MAPTPEKHPVLVIAGPTAGGKSALALRLAEAFGGSVINADSMQVYRDLHVVTARPSAADEARVPHRLYGVLPGREVCSVARWAEMARREVLACQAARRLPVLCGGTGLYLKGLMRGLSPVPEIPPEIRAAMRGRMAEIGSSRFHAELGLRDPAMAARLAPGDTQRLVRAAEVLEATGRSLADWQAVPDRPVLPDAAFHMLTLMPARPDLHARINRRFERMVREQGALAEVAALDALDIPPDRPVCKSLGVPELRAHLAGETGLEEAIARGQAATRQFAKRQCTFFRHQFPEAEILRAQFSESLARQTFNNVRQFLLTVQDGIV